MKEVEQTKKERISLEEEFKGVTVDMQSKFLQALAAEGFLDNERIINTNLDEVYGSMRTQVAEIVETQNTLVERIQVFNTYLRTLREEIFMEFISRFRKKDLRISREFNSAVETVSKVLRNLISPLSNILQCCFFYTDKGNFSIASSDILKYNH